jgi:hypothetical protein
MEDAHTNPKRQRGASSLTLRVSVRILHAEVIAEGLGVDRATRQNGRAPRQRRLQRAGPFDSGFAPP